MQSEQPDRDLLVFLTFKTGSLLPSRVNDVVTPNCTKPEEEVPPEVYSISLPRRKQHNN